MSTYVLTGANGFLGFHVRAALKEHGHTVRVMPVGDKYDSKAASKLLRGAHNILHLAGVNRGHASDILNENIRFARQVEDAMKRTDQGPKRIVFANSIQSANGSPYGDSKAEAARILGQVAFETGSRMDNLMLPNLFGEFGRPFYNSVTATFCHMISRGETPEVWDDKEIRLLHAQHAAEVIIGTLPESSLSKYSIIESVSGLKRRITDLATTYEAGEFPSLELAYDRDLFNTYRSYLYPQGPLIITRHADARGSFFEIVRNHGGTGQTSFSTTETGITRGDHFHRRKVERFTVLSGRAEISVRLIGTAEKHVYRLDGDNPRSVDMPTFVAHSIKNVGNEPLLTAFWTNDIFDKSNPDTISEGV